MRVGIVLVGDELLSGKRWDKHHPKVIELLANRGMALAWARTVGDDEALLTQTFRETLSSGDLVFSFGGIGATPDDLTRQAAAAAAGVALTRHPEAAAIIEQRYGEQAYPHRIQMAEFPEGARIIPNPINRIAGFSLGDHHFVPGFPNMAWPMVEWVLDTYYPHLAVATPPVERLLQLSDVPESEIIPVMEELLRRFPQIKLSSLPSTENRSQVELGVKGMGDDVAQATAWLQQALTQRGVSWEYKA